MNQQSRRSFVRTAFAAAVGWFVPAPAADAAPDPRALATRVSGYVGWYDEQLTALVAEERYLQQRTVPPANGHGSMLELRSDIGWIRLPSLHDAIAVRDVLRVDGEPTRRGGRLRRMLAHPTDALAAQVLQILNESAAYNLEAGALNINFPTFPLTYLREKYVGRQRWRLTGHDSGPHVLSFRERRRPTIVRTGDGEHLHGEGRFWIDRVSGRVERCEIRVGGSRHSYSTTVTFAHDAAIDLWVPAEMHDVLERDAVRVTGVATYSNYRRFRTSGRLVPQGQ